MIGVPIVLGMKPSGTANKWSGQVYNAEDGKTYLGSLTLQDVKTPISLKAAFWAAWSAKRRGGPGGAERPAARLVACKRLVACEEPRASARYLKSGFRGMSPADGERRI